MKFLTDVYPTFKSGTSENMVTLVTLFLEFIILVFFEYSHTRVFRKFSGKVTYSFYSPATPRSVTTRVFRKYPGKVTHAQV